MSDFRLGRILRGERFQYRSTFLEMRAPQVGVRKEIRGDGILLPTSGVGRALANGAEFRVQLSSGGEKFEEAVAQRSFFKPVLAQQRFPGCKVSSCGRFIGIQKIANKNRIVREALVGVQVQPQVKPGAATDHTVEILLEIAALELCNRIAGQLLELRVSLVAQIETREFVVPGFVWEPGHGATVDFLLLRAQPVLIEKHGEPFIEAGIVGVAVDLAAQHSERGRNLFHLHQARQVALQNACVFRRACTSLPCGRCSRTQLKGLADLVPGDVAF